MTASRELYELARRVGGAIDVATVAEIGLSPALLEREVRAGRLRKVHRSVFVPTAVRVDHDVRLRAALLAAGPEAVVSHRSAAVRHDCLSARADTIVEMTVPHGHRLRLHGVVIHRTRELPQRQIVSIDGMCFTSLERTLADLGAVVPRWVVQESVDRAIAAGRTSITRLYGVLDEIGRCGRNGVGVLRSVLDAWVLGESKPESVLEIMFGRLLAPTGLPMPEFQYLIRDGADAVARVDACWPDRHLIAELDGFEAHGTRRAFDRDLERQNRLIALGWTPLRFSWSAVVRSPQVVTTTLRPFLIGPLPSPKPLDVRGPG